ncbi:magnesium transporter [Heliorestis acidaminivorans]|uniref:Magnesium transporter MgtE n=1 Tax=Heliorestis acidaminivorans TaxID=553427 RepID=A0A6I0F7C5_9FIRM|nr:magnesium transporter [Heliorestis acidaminivorans]KAB2953283.1 magnesium transporter [Heliorestis acidaminivorans]
MTKAISIHGASRPLEHERKSLTRTTAIAEIIDETREEALYAPESVGTIMHDNFLAVPEEYSVAEAMQVLRQNEIGQKSKYYVYVVDSCQVLKGIVPIRNLLTASEKQKIAEITCPDVVSVSAHQDREEVATFMQSRDFLSVPVVNEQGVLVGIVNARDVLGIVEAETTEDFHKMASVSALKTSLKSASIYLLFQKRVGWLLLLVFVNIFSSTGIAYFEDTIASMVALVFFLPLLIGSSGNAGSQSATMMVRALATGDVKLRDWASFLGKELVVSGLLGLAMGLAVATIGFFRVGTEVAIVVALTMQVVVIVGSLIGMSLPFALDKLKLDPATASGPLVTSIADIAGILIYFSIATWYLGHVGIM